MTDNINTSGGFVNPGTICTEGGDVIGRDKITIITCQPQTKTTIKSIRLMLPFDQVKGMMRFREVEKLYGYTDMNSMGLQAAIDEMRDEERIQRWNRKWHLDAVGNDSVIKDDAITLVYDLVEWLFLNQIAVFGNTVQAVWRGMKTNQFILPAKLEVTTIPRHSLFNEAMVNRIWQALDHHRKQTFKVPIETEIELFSLEPDLGIKTYNVAPIRSIMIRNPAGILKVTPEQRWTRITTGQPYKLLHKRLRSGTHFCLLEIVVNSSLQLNQGILEFDGSDTMAVYQHWLLWLQLQFERHLDWNHFLKFDIERQKLKLQNKILEEE